MAITSDLNKVLNNINDKKSDYGRLLNFFGEQISQNASGTNFKSTLNYNKSNESFYLISTKWVTNAIMYIKAILNNEEPEKMHKANNVCLLYFSNEGDLDEEEKKELLGHYPGDLNNFYLLSGKIFSSIQKIK